MNDDEKEDEKKDDRCGVPSGWAKQERQFIGFCRKHTTQAVGVSGVDVLDVRRVVFVSLIGLHKTWKLAPLYVLYPCIVFVPVAREWLHSKSDQHVKHPDIASDEAFMTFLRFKNDQGYIFWAENVCDMTANEDVLIAPFWKTVSKRLVNMYDPVTRRNYAPLKGDDFLKDRQQFVLRFEKNRAVILAELYFAQMKFKAVQEILYQSNNTLNPIVSFAPHCININYNRSAHPSVCLKGFWISPEYDPEM